MPADHLLLAYELVIGVTQGLAGDELASVGTVYGVWELIALAEQQGESPARAQKARMICTHTLEHVCIPRLEQRVLWVDESGREAAVKALNLATSTALEWRAALGLTMPPNTPIGVRTTIN